MNRTELGTAFYNCVDLAKLKELTGLELVVGSVNNELYISLVNRETEEKIILKTFELPKYSNLLTEVLDNFKSKKYCMAFDGDGKHVEIYDNPEKFYNQQVGDEAMIPLLKLKLVEDTNVNHSLQDLQSYIELLEKVSKLRSMGYTSLSTTELEKTINSILQLWEF